jgi:hypothetical protein
MQGECGLFAGKVKIATLRTADFQFWKYQSHKAGVCPARQSRNQNKIKQAE